jgi:ADP-ribose pyrophosphatase YjhB (NUDIX family)
MPHDPILTWFIVLVAVRMGDRWLLVQETKNGYPWHLPSGRVDPGESFLDAALRETLEETGISIHLDGIVRIEHSPKTDSTARVRVVFLAHPAGSSVPKHKPDQESLGAGWFTLEQIKTLKLRAEETVELFEYLSKKPVIAPLTILTVEGMPY